MLHTWRRAVGNKDIRGRDVLSWHVGFDVGINSMLHDVGEDHVVLVGKFRGLLECSVPL